jgi:hypothetical protein
VLNPLIGEQPPLSSAIDSGYFLPNATQQQPSARTPRLL